MFKVLLPAIILSVSASITHAACSTPTANAGGIFYNTGQNAVQFCDGTDWYNTGLVTPTASGTSCTTPASPEAGIYYNTTQNTVQFCNGDDWVNMGTMKFPSATGTTCTTPAGPEGSMFFNTTTKTMQFCNGDDWVNATYLTVAADAIDGIELAKIQASDKEANDQFGVSVSIDGDYAVVGAYTEGTGGLSAGAAYIFKRTGSTWAQESKIQATDKQSDDRFGHSVAISGDYIIAGAYNEDTGGSNSGAAYIFKRTGTSWAQEAKIQASDSEANDFFGYSVSISGDYVIVGAHGEDSGATGSGAAYVFKRTGTSWAESSKIQSLDKESNDLFAFSVSISGDYAVVGAKYEDTGGANAGAAYMFKRTGSTWAQEAKVQASDKESNDYFGISVAIHGDYAIIGAQQEDTGGAQAGAAYVFKRTGVNWANEVKIQPSDSEAGDYFGTSVAIHDDHAIVGSMLEDSGAADAGAAYVFKRTGLNWIEESKVQASDAEAGDYFAGSVSISGDHIVIGVSYEDTGGSSAGAAYIFD